MRRREMKTQPAREYEEQVEVRCELCGAEAPHPNGADGLFWGEHWASRVGVRMCAVDGSSYPEGGSKQETGYDVCLDCWNAKIVPYMLSLGAKQYQSYFEW